MIIPSDDVPVKAPLFTGLFVPIGLVDTRTRVGGYLAAVGVLKLAGPLSRPIQPCGLPCLPA